VGDTSQQILVFCHCPHVRFMCFAYTHDTCRMFPHTSFTIIECRHIRVVRSSVLL